MSSLFEKTSSAALTVAAVAFAAILLHREFFSTAGASGQQKPAAPVYDSRWTTFANNGIRIGATGAPVTIVEFADFECPFCGKFQEQLNAARMKFGDKVSVIFVHFPLPQHRFAIPSARLAECANAQGRFDQAAGALFAKQDSLGLKSWMSYAVDAGIRDTSAVAACLREARLPQRILDGETLAAVIDVHATPTVFINGWRYAAPPSETTLDEAITTIIRRGASDARAP